MRLVEPAERRALQGAYGGEPAPGELFAHRKFRETGEDFVPLCKNHGVGFFAVWIFGNQPGLHSGSQAQVRHPVQAACNLPAPAYPSIGPGQDRPARESRTQSGPSGSTGGVTTR